MANKEQTYTIKIDAELSSLQDKVTRAKQLLDGFMSSGKAPKGLVSSFEKLEGLLGRISDKSKQAPSKSLFSGVEKDLSNAELLFGEIIRSLDSLKDVSKDIKLELFPPESRAQIQAAINGLKEYQKILKELKEKESEVEAARKVSEKADKAATTAKQSKADIKRKREKVETKRDSLQGQVTALEMDPEKNAVKIAKLKGDIAELDLEIKNLTTDYNTATRTLTEANKAAAEAKTKYEDLSTELDKLETESLDALSASAKKAGREIEDIDGETPRKKMERLNSTMQTFVDDSLAGLPENAQKAKVAMDNYLESVDDATNKTRQAKQADEEYQAGLSERKAFEQRIKDFLGMAGAAQLFRSALRDAMSTITELDATMTEMSVVTDLDVSDYWDQLPEYTARANELGLAINDVYKADTLFYQQGLKTNEVVAISTETMKMAKIAGLDTAEATDRMTAALRGFNMEMNETSAQKISDVYSELAAITAADVDEISTAMTKTASIASSAGMEFETTAAFLSQIIETTRESAETAGTAMKTVIARFQELKKAPEDIGEVDGEIVDANAIETALRSVGVELRDSAGQFRELDDVFLELSSKWDSLDKNTQRYIATIAAGSRQQSRFIAMMSDYGRTQDLVTAANNSAGASNRQYQKTMESLETKINKLKNAWHEFTMGILDSDLVKIGVDILTKFLEIVNKGTSAFDGMLGTITKIAGVLAAFKLGSKIFEKIKQPLLDAFSWAAETAGLKGYEAGKNYAKQAKKGAEDQVKEDDGTKEPEKPKEEAPKTEGDTEKKNLGAVLKEKTGYNELIQPLVDRKKARKKYNTSKKDAEAKSAAFGAANTRLEEAQMRFDSAMENQYDNPEEYSAALDEIIDAQSNYNKKLEESQQAQNNLKLSEEEFVQSGKIGFDSLSQGLTKMGQTAVAAGSAMSMIGGMISTLIPGGEKVGEVVSGIGQAVTVLGTVLMAIPGIISAIQTILSMPPLGIILIILAAVLAAVIAIVAVINNNSPEKKLEKAAEEAEKMAEAANDAAEAYDKLASALDNLDDKYDALNELTQGTKEWNKAVQEINSSVLDLIDEYPELAKFVENKEGVLTIDIDDSGVQDILQKAETQKTVTQNASNLAKIKVSEAEAGVQFGEMEAVKKVVNKRGWDTFGNSVGTGAAIGAGTLGTAGAITGGVLGGPAAAALLGAVGAIGGGLVGGLVGTIVGAIAGPNEASKTATDDALQNAVSKLAEHVSEGGGTDFDSMFDYLHNTMKLSADEAEILAKEFSEDLDSLTSYGESVRAIEMQQKAAYNSIAVSAQGLANTMGMSAEQIKQSSILVDGDVSGELYEKKMSELADVDLNKDIEDNEEVQKAIQETYGEGAKIDRNGKVTYVKDGENKEVTLSADQVKTMVATSYATKESAKAIEYSDDAIRIAGEKLGSNAINALYSANEGGALTQADKDSLVSSLGGMDAAKEWDLLSDSQKKERANSEGGIPPEIKAAWDAMGDAQVAYGGDIVNFMDDLVEGVTLSDKAFEKSRERVTAMGITAQKVVKDFMTADMATAYTKKLEEVAEKAGGYGESGGAAQIDAEVNKILEKYADNIDKQVEIQNRINMADWESKESLLSLQIDLQTQYGYTRAEAEALIQTMSDAAFATSKMTTTVEVFGELQKASDRLNRNLERMAQLQWEYNNALEGGEGNIGELVREQLNTYLDDAAQYQRSFDASKTAMAQVYAQGGDVTRFGGYDLRDFTSLDAEGNLITTNPETGLSLQDLITTNPELEDEIQKWKDSYDSHSSEAQKASEGLRNTLDDIKALEQQGKDAYSELFNMTKEALTSGMQEQIDLQSELLDATKDANSALISQMQAAIDEDRRQRELEKTEENLNSLYSQQAYLAMDTSGMNALQSQELDAQIEQAEQDYQDTLVDQTIQSLQDANARAEEQRERQIAIAEQQLASYQNSDAFLLKAENMMNEMLAADNWMTTELGEKLRDKFMVGMSPEEKKNWEASITGTVDLANVWKVEDWNAVKDNVANTLNSVNGIAEKMGADIENDAAGRSVHDKAEELSGKGYDVESLGYTKNKETKMWEFTGGGSATDAKDAEDKLNKMSMASLDEGTAKEISDLKTSIQKKQEIATKIHGKESTQTTKYNIASQEEFNKSYNAATGEYEYNGGKYSSYTDYLTKKNSVEVSGYKNLSAMEAYGGAAVSGEIRNLTKAEWNNNKQANFDMKVGSSGWDNLVTTSQDHGGDTATKLNRINQDTGGTDIVITKVGGHHGIPGHGDTDHSGGYQLWIKNPNDSGKWRYVVNEGEEGSPTPYGLVTSGRSELDTKKKTYTKYFYETGGLADFTGPAWLDGTPSKPEYILNAAQTERFFSLVDILEGYDNSKSSGKSGDNYFDIEINVEKLENDYDIEKVADKIRRMIYDDATYRNVNAINHIR